MRHSTLNFSLLACGTALLLCAAGLHAQTIYRIVGADGKITFSDKPPTDATRSTASTATTRPVSLPDAALPFELRQIVSRYPVTLYSGSACAPCNSGRMLLQGRGIPFTEHTVSTPEDAEALKRISGDNALPFLTIGGQKIKGFSEAEWVQFLDAANYPATSALPANYRNAPAKPLVVAQKPTPSQAQAETPAPPTEEKSAATDPVAPPPVSPSSPTGIRF